MTTTKNPAAPAADDLTRLRDELRQARADLASCRGLLKEARKIIRAHSLTRVTGKDWDRRAIQALQPKE